MANAVPVHQADTDEGVKAPSVKVKVATVKADATSKPVSRPATGLKLGDNQTQLADGTIRTES